MKYIFLIVIVLHFFVSACSKIRESAGVTRQNLDEFKVIENPPLVIPPDFNLLPPEQLETKKIEEAEQDLAEEILFGLDNNNSQVDNDLSTMSNILEEAKVDESNSNIREEIDQFFANELKTEGIFQNDWNDTNEVLDAVKESERIRNKLSSGESIAEDDIPTKEVKTKKKKRFFFF